MQSDTNLEVTSKCSNARKARGKKTRQPSIAAILREAYRIYTRDPHTRTAVRACLGS